MELFRQLVFGWTDRWTLLIPKVAEKLKGLKVAKKTDG